MGKASKKNVIHILVSVNKFMLLELKMQRIGKYMRKYFRKLRKVVKKKKGASVQIVRGFLWAGRQICWKRMIRFPHRFISKIYISFSGMKTSILTQQLYPPLLVKAYISL